MKNLPKVITGSVIWIVLSLLSPGETFAVTIASQDQVFSDQLNVWKVVQELGTNLSGTAQSFTFRVSTSKPDADQFDFTAGNAKIYDKSNGNSSIPACIQKGNVNDHLRGLAISKTGVPAGFEDVTLDFSCNKYDFIPGHRYLIKIGNANFPNTALGRIQFAAAAYGPGGHGGSTDQFPVGGLRYAFDNADCDQVAYVWNSQKNNNGCNVWTSTNDDLYFVLNNNAPPPKLPVIFIPGIGGSELKATQDIIWSQNDGHNGTYSHAYGKDEKIWVNQDEAIKLGDDDYFDVLRLKPDGVTPEAPLSLTGNVNSLSYGEVDSFFQNIGYVKGTNFFVFSYDWRKDIQSTKTDLDNLIETAKQKSGQNKVNLVAHSLGGLVGRNYIADSAKASKVNLLVELGVPHLGTAESIKNILYGTALSTRVLFIKLNIIPATEINDVVNNFPAVFQLLPSKQFFNFYNNSDANHPFPFEDDRDIDNNQVTGPLNYDQNKTLIKNLGKNMAVFDFGEQLHNNLDSSFNNPNGVKIYELVGSGIDTIGQIRETWFVQWPINLIPVQDEIKIDGDGTVPTFSAALRDGSKDISGANTIYYIKQEHGDMTKASGPAMQTVKSILNADNSLPADAKNQKISLDGEQVSSFDADLDLYDDSNNHTGLDSNGQVETNIPGTSYNKNGHVTHAFINKSASKVKVKIKSTGSKEATVKVRKYSQDVVATTDLYKDVPLDNSNVETTIDQTVNTAPVISIGNQQITPSAEVTGNATSDQNPPSTIIQVSGDKDGLGQYSGGATVTLSGNDSDSGILKTEYSLDNGQTVQTYTGPFTITSSGETVVQVKSIDKLGNEEIPQSITVKVAASSASPTPTPTPATTSATTISNNSSATNITNNTSSNNSSNNPLATPIPTKESENTQSTKTAVLGINTTSSKNDKIESSQPRSDEKNNKTSIKQPGNNKLQNLLMASVGVVTLVSVGLFASFLKPPPK